MGIGQGREARDRGHVSLDPGLWRAKARRAVQEGELDGQPPQCCWKICRKTTRQVLRPGESQFRGHGRDGANRGGLVGVRISLRRIEG